MTRQLLTFSLVSVCLVGCGNAPVAHLGPDGGGPMGTVDVHGQVVGPTGVALSGMNVAIGPRSAVTAPFAPSMTNCAVPCTVVFC